MREISISLTARCGWEKTPAIGNRVVGSCDRQDGSNFDHRGQRGPYPVSWSADARDTGLDYCFATGPYHDFTDRISPATAKQKTGRVLSANPLRLDCSAPVHLGSSPKDPRGRKRGGLTQPTG